LPLYTWFFETDIRINYNNSWSMFHDVKLRKISIMSMEVTRCKETTKQEVSHREMESTLFELDSTLSNEFENTYLQHEAGLGYRYNKDKIRIYSSFDYEISILDSDRLFPGFENTKRTFKNFVPRMVFIYDMNENTNIRLYYRGDTDAPSVRQLQDVIDNSNPIQISTGNPDLEQEYEHRLYTRIRTVDPETPKSFFMYMGGRIRNNYLGNATYIAARDTLIQGDVLLRQGGQLNRPENLDKYWDIRSYFSFGFPLKFIKSNLNLSARANISNLSSFGQGSMPSGGEY
ncbi:MAG: outer membrane beta-barrel protein, partial [Cyclobacteriaceae bacterium]